MEIQLHFVVEGLRKQTTDRINSKQEWQQSSRFNEMGKNWTVAETNEPSVKTTLAVECWDECSVLCFVRLSRVAQQAAGFLIEVSCMIESTRLGPQTRTAQLFSATHGSEHLLLRGKSIISFPSWRKCTEQMRKQHTLMLLLLGWCYSQIHSCSQWTWLFILWQVWETATSLCNWKLSALPLH